MNKSGFLNILWKDCISNFINLKYKYINVILIYLNYFQKFIKIDLLKKVSSAEDMNFLTFLCFKVFLF
jgi:hypothetical protein